MLQGKLFLNSLSLEDVGYKTFYDLLNFITSGYYV